MSDTPSGGGIHFFGVTPVRDPDLASALKRCPEDALAQSINLILDTIHAEAEETRRVVREEAEKTRALICAAAQEASEENMNEFDRLRKVLPDPTYDD